MHLGLMMECDYRAGKTQEEAFREAFSTAEHAEEWGFDGVWLAERHFAPPESGRAIPSVVASPLIIATAIASRTTRIRVGTAVLVLPLGHPVRLAEEVATLDHISQGRLNLGIGRSGFPWAYEGYDIPYAESRERFREFFDVMQLAWTHERFSYQGKYYTFKDVCLIPKPYQKPHPPLRYASTSRESFTAMGQLGLPIFAGLGGAAVPELARAIAEYRAAWREAGHPGDGDVMLRAGIYVAEDKDRAFS
jgi:alkanesulfonate monooxygenase SsuD/methylene tetrahydromethanopterin reductase-like flavin-dependent oxidoreductase (luciferase family)